ncbi:putative leucine-rich repeat-containing protein DDB_G0290503 [Argopecten irradians]|uniref:putative leucine-rich repeat-containing protein DDB_G0290503 n=1 Tax=Argopecten irradians TaxID=31199 RepID=UPI00371008BA
MDGEIQDIITGKNRQDRTARLVFNRENLKNLRKAINDLFDIFHDVLERDFEFGAFFKVEDIMKRLEDVDSEHWRSIRMTYLDEERHGYCNGNFSDDELKCPAKIMLDMLQCLKFLRDGVYDKIDQKHYEILEIERKTSEFRHQTDCIQGQLMEEKLRMAQKVIDAAKQEGKLRYLEKALQEKTDRLQELQRTSAANLWDKEKERILKDSNKRIAELEQELASVRNSQNNMNKRMTKIDDQYKALKLRQEKTTGSLGSDSDGDEVNSLKREGYIKEKDIAHLEGELYNQQKLFVGVLGGLRTDINKLSEQFYDHETHSRDPAFVKLSRTMDKLYDATSQATLDSAKMMLPPHYTYYDTDLKLRRIRRLSKVPSVPQIVTQVPPKPCFIREYTPPSQLNGSLAKRRNEMMMPPVSENPVIVDPSTDKLNGTVYLRHFAHMSQKFLLDHWAKFKEFDNNGDRMLDMQEVTKILTSLGCSFTSFQVEEAMKEVDVDNSNTLDFYEYMLVVEKVVRRSGKANLFTKGLSKQNNTEVSKACVIQ